MLSSYVIFSQNIRKKFEEPELKRKMKDAEVVKINGLYRKAIEHHVGDATLIKREILNAPNCVVGDHRNCGSKCKKKGKFEVCYTIAV